MIIKTRYCLKTFPEFNSDILEILPSFYSKSNSKNWTTQQHCGWTEALYEAQGDSQAIEYMQTRLWRYHFNGVIGEGVDLTEAIKDHKVKYDEHLR